MKDISKLLEKNRQWSASKTRRDSAFFSRQATVAIPKYLFLGCSGLAVPANQLLGLDHSEVLVHNNVANLVVHSDMSLLSVLQYAVGECKMEDIIVCGHYDCPGVAAAVSRQQSGLLDSWLTQVRDVVRLHEKELLRIASVEQRQRRLVELNVIEQVRNLAKTNIVQNAMQDGKSLRLHGLVYDSASGLLQNLNVDPAVLGGWASIYETHPVAPVLTYSRGAQTMAPAGRTPKVAGYRHSA